MYMIHVLMILRMSVAVRGIISFKITDYRQFIKLHRLSNFNLDDFQKKTDSSVVARYVKDTVANAPGHE